MRKKIDPIKFITINDPYLTESIGFSNESSGDVKIVFNDEAMDFLNENRDKKIKCLTIIEPFEDIQTSIAYRASQEINPNIV